MKKFTLFERISALFEKKLKGETLASALSLKFKKQPRYKTTHFGAETRKKSFWEKWQSKKASHQQHRALKPIGLDSKERSGPPFRLVIFLGVLLFGGYLFVTGPMKILYGNWSYFRIHEIEINGCLMTAPGSLRKFANISYEMNMLTLDPKAMQERLQMHPWIVRAEVKRIWPDGLAVFVKEYRPHALIAQAGEEGFSYLDRNGRIFAAVVPGQELDFPVITGLDAFNTIEERERLLGEATSFLYLAGRNNPNLPAQNISEIHFNSDGDLILYLVEQPFPIYFGKGDIKRKYYQLRRVLEVLYRKRKGKAIIDNVAYIHMDYQENKVLVARSHTG